MFVNIFLPNIMLLCVAWSICANAPEDITLEAGSNKSCVLVVSLHYPTTLQYRIYKITEKCLFV